MPFSSEIFSFRWWSPLWLWRSLKRLPAHSGKSPSGGLTALTAQQLRMMLLHHFPVRLMEHISLTGKPRLFTPLSCSGPRLSLWPEPTLWPAKLDLLSTWWRFFTCFKPNTFTLWMIPAVLHSSKSTAQAISHMMASLVVLKPIRDQWCKQNCSPRLPSFSHGLHDAWLCRTLHYCPDVVAPFLAEWSRPSVSRGLSRVLVDSAAHQTFVNVCSASTMAEPEIRRCPTALNAWASVKSVLMHQGSEGSQNPTITGPPPTSIGLSPQYGDLSLVTLQPLPPETRHGQPYHVCQNGVLEMIRWGYSDRPPHHPTPNTFRFRSWKMILTSS